ncbi:MAG: aminopeptidase P N-terminal domain-containing protein [Planctomycetes bacterium]|nr:aminopeptidase P N-terminal domain-containing protein [Planctomycetota bacterium]
MKALTKQLAVIWLLLPVLTSAQDDFWYQRDFSLDEFAQRRGKVFEKIGTEAVALLQGAPAAREFDVFRQDNEFFYLCGIEVPQAYLLLDGRSGKTAVYLRLPSRGKRSGQTADEYASSVKKETGIDAVYGLESLLGHLENVSELYVLLGSRGAKGAPRREMASVDRSEATDLLSSDPLGEGRFVNLIQNCFPKLAIKNLSPTVDSLRVIKSTAEIELLRRAGKLSALSVIEAMRSTEVGVEEYQLDAVSKYIFFANGARGEGYPAIIAGGANMKHGHYFRKDSVLNDGDIVLMDHAPDCGYYTSDIGRIWPVNGRYSPWQRELYGFMVKYHKAVIKRIRPGVTADQIMQGAKGEMEEVLNKTKFSKPIYERAARNTYGHMSHTVGMSVHDVGSSRGPLKPGMVFAVDPQMRVPEEELYIRIEDTVVVTEDGVEILTGSAPWDLDEVEKLMKEEGILQKYPPVFARRKKP